MSTKETYVKVPAQKATKRKVTKVYCDVGGEFISGNGGYGRTGKCTICSRDVCRKHEKIDPHSPEDYPDGYCTICYDIKYVKYGDRQIQLDNKHAEDKQELNKSVLEESLKDLDEADGRQTNEA